MASKVLITGANRGIGLEMAAQLAARGDHVHATCRDPENAVELTRLAVQVSRLDVTDSGSVKALVERLGQNPLDVLINNAGVGVGGGTLGRLDYGVVEHYFRTNAVAPLRLAEALVPNLRQGKRKLIVNVTSRMGSIGDNTSGGAYAYRASKAALNMFTRSLAVDLESDGITCFVVHPGWVQTAMGGASAPLPLSDSVAGIVRLIENATPATSGRFFDFSGDEVAW